MNTVHAPAIQFSIAISVSTDDLVQAIAAGMVGGAYGYAYWCDAVRVLNHPDLSDVQIAHHVLSGGTARFFETEGEGGKRTGHNLTREKLLVGFGRWVVEFQSARGSYDPKTGITEFDIDSPASDAIIQFALFGEQRYG